MENHGRFLCLKKFLLSFTTTLILPATALGHLDYLAGEYVVRLKPGHVVARSANIMGGFVTHVLGPDKDIVVVERSLVEPMSIALEELKKHPMVLRAEPNYYYRASQLPNDTDLDQLWGLINKDKGISGGVDISAGDAWSLTTGSEDVVVAVIDSGVNYNHPDLKNNMWTNDAELNGQTGVDDDNNGYIDDIYGYDFVNNDADPMDDNDHGSHCAGTIGAEGNNDEGVVGVNWKVKIMALKFLSAGGGGSLAGAIQAIDYATQMGAQVMNNSWGGGGYSETLKEAIERAEQAGVLFVAAAGNEGKNNDSSASYPANYEVGNVISVAAVGSKGRLANFSNYGKKSVHIAAPGVGVYSTVSHGGYGNLSGTSMATPHVAGVAALLLALEPSLSYQEVRRRMLRTSVRLAPLRNKVEHGFLNAYNTLTDTIPPADPNDPEPWPYLEQQYSTAHPYSNDTEQEFVVTVPGAVKVAVHFARFATENRYDKVTFFDANGNNLGEMSGQQNDSYSPAAQGDTIILKFTSDYSITAYGFDVDRVHYQLATPSP